MSSSTVTHEIVEDGRVLDVIQVGIVIVGRGYVVQEWNHWMSVHSGVGRDEIVGHSLFRLYPSLNYGSFLRGCKTVLAFGNVVYFSQKLHNYLFPIPVSAAYRKHFEYMQQSCTMTPVRSDGEIDGILITVQDVTERVLLERQLREVVRVDGLTSAYNRRFMEERLLDEIARGARYGTETSVILFDVDYFKNVNDNYGHLAGDRVLKEVVARAQQCLRQVDVLARYGGEEFFVILPETGRQGAGIVAERLRRQIAARPIEVGEHRIPVTASFGRVTISPGIVPVEHVILRADQAMYNAKRTGRNCVVEHGEVGGTPTADGRTVETGDG